MKKIFSIFICVIISQVIFSQTHSDSSKVSEESKKNAKKKIESIRNDIINGKIDFASAAIKYSQDPGSAANGGLLQKIEKGTFVPEFDAVAFSIKENTVSDIFETEYGYHILIVLDRRRDEIDVSHILIIPQPDKK